MYLRLLNNRVKLTKYTGIGVNRISQSFIHTKSSQLLLNETHSVRSMSLSHTDSATSPKKFDSIPFIQVHKYSTTTFDFASVLFRQKNINRSSFRKFSVLKNTPSKSLENTVEKQFEQTSKNPVEQTPKTPETPIEKTLKPKLNKHLKTQLNKHLKTQLNTHLKNQLNKHLKNQSKSQAKIQLKNQTN